jgi:cell division protein FtsW
MKKVLQKPDKIFLYTFMALLVFGLVMISSAGIAYSKTRFGDAYFFLKRQFLFGFLPGLMVFFIIQKINYNFWKKTSFPLFVLSIIFLILVFVPNFGSKIYGASRWVQLGFFSFQPSEMLKFSLILYLSAWLSSRREEVSDFFEGLIPFLTVIGFVSFLLIKQPDMGTLGIIIFIAITIFFVSGSKISHMFFLGISGIVAFFAMIKLESYRMDRFMVFLHPELDPRGIGYQINQALLAIGSGGLFGLGLGHSLQKFNYLPEPVGDSIFAVIGEELGLVGVTFLIILYVVLAIRGINIAKKAPDNFSRLVVVGVISWIIFQAFINISAISGLIPLTGVPLPMVSYGGTSLVFLMAAAGLVFNISKFSEK